VEEHVAQRFAGGERAPIDKDRVALQVGLITKAGHLAVDRDPTGRNQRLGLTARAESGSGDQFLQALR
jgi:hypothetical protein